MPEKDEIYSWVYEYQVRGRWHPFCIYQNSTVPNYYTGTITRVRIMPEEQWYDSREWNDDEWRT